MSSSERGPETDHFSHEELCCKCCGANEMKAPFLDLLEKFREKYGKPVAVSSAYRCAKHNDAVSKTGGKGPHTTGWAIDFPVATAADAFRAAAIAFDLGFTGIGVKQHGVSGRMIHLDSILGVPHIPRPALWSYP